MSAILVQPLFSGLWLLQTFDLYLGLFSTKLNGAKKVVTFVQF